MIRAFLKATHATKDLDAHVMRSNPPHDKPAFEVNAGQCEDETRRKDP